MELNKIYCGDCLEVMKTFPDNSIDCCVTSPPYYNLRSYLPEDHPDKDKEIGFGGSPEEYVTKLVEIFREVRRILKLTGVCYLNLGDSWASNGIYIGKFVEDHPERQNLHTDHHGRYPQKVKGVRGGEWNIKKKDLLMIPARVAIALSADGWYLRSDIIYAKRNTMPNPVSDRPVASYEHVFLLTKTPKYYYDWESIATEPAASTQADRRPKGVLRQRTNENSKYHEDCDPTIAAQFRKQDGVGRSDYTGFNDRYTPVDKVRRRDVWTLTVPGTKIKHFACVDSETECLTIGGWRKYYEIKEGTPIFTFNMVTNCLELQPVNCINTYHYRGNLISVFGRSSNMLMTSNHRCVVYKYGSKNATIVESQNIKQGMKFPVAAKLVHDFLIPTDSIEFYELLGWFFAEGHFTDAGSIHITQSLGINKDKCERISYLIDLLCDEWNVKELRYLYKGMEKVNLQWTISGEMRKKIRHMIPDKFVIPEHFLMLPEEYVLAFLNGFVEGDGHIRIDKRISIPQKSKEVIDMIQAMFLRVGKSCILSQRGNCNWTAFITSNTSRCFRNSHSSLIKNDYVYDGIVWCPSVENGTWVARRGGRPFITGNSFNPKLVEMCIASGCPEEGVMLDPFAGICTVGLVAKSLNRNYIGIELNPEYVKIAENYLNDYKYDPENKKVIKA